MVTTKSSGAAPKNQTLTAAKLLSLVKYDEHGLVPVAAVDRETGELLMLAFANRHSLELTLKTGFTHYWSRSRSSLWKKGETSGHIQRLYSLELDCDGDTLIARVDQTGAACHTGAPTCFFRRSGGEGGSSRALFDLVRTIRSRRGADPESSYTAKLLSQSAEKRGKKLLEETAELLLATSVLETASGAGRKKAREAAVYEAADVMYHYLLALEGAGLGLADVWQELSRRFGQSGIEEKRRRKK